MDSDDRALLQEEFAATKIGNRTDSAAMLAWFLANVERLEPEQVPDAICDGASDKGIDAITVDDDLREITLYQGKRMQSATKTQGDNDLKQLVAASEYFMSDDTVEGLLASKPNLELQAPPPPQRHPREDRRGLPCQAAGVRHQCAPGRRGQGDPRLAEMIDDHH